MRDNSYQKMSKSKGTYNDQKIHQPPQRLTGQEMLTLLDTHPLFTGRCPCCEIPLKVDKPEWHCHQCGAKSSGTVGDDRKA